MDLDFISGQSETAAEEKPLEENLHPSPEPSPDDLSSPNPDHATPLLQAQQRPPSRAERDETRTVSSGGNGKIDETEAGYEKEGMEIESALSVSDREQLEQGRTEEKDSEQERTEKKDSEDKEAEDKETVDEGLPSSKGSEGESEEDSEAHKEHSDANNNSLETPQDDQDEFIDIPEPPAQVGHRQR